MKTQKITLSLLALFLFCAVGLVFTNPALADDDDDTLNTECGYERRAVDDSRPQTMQSKLLKNALTRLNRI